MERNQDVLSVLEVWQSQSYWPISGWGSPMGSTPHYQGQLIPRGSDFIPDALVPPSGWEWLDRWSVDVSPIFGNPDSDGWYYAAKFEKLDEMLREKCASGVPAKTSIVRKRRWIRTVTCVSPALRNEILLRCKKIEQIRRAIENSLKEKEKTIMSVKFYEENRSFLFAQSLNLATQGSLDSLGTLKELIEKLKRMLQFLSDRTTIDMEYAKKLELLSKKYTVTGHPHPPSPPVDSPSEVPSPDLKDSLTIAAAESVRSLARIGASAARWARGTTNTSIQQEMKGQPAGHEQVQVDAAHVFFSSTCFVSDATSSRVLDFAQSLVEKAGVEEVHQLVKEGQGLLKEARSTFRKNSDICRLSESAVRNCFFSVQFVFDSVFAAALEDISLLSEELNSLRGSASASDNVCVFGAAAGRYNSNKNRDIPPPDTTTMVAPTVNVMAPCDNETSSSKIREDLWLSVQRYRHVVRESQAALCVLIAEFMDLELQLQIYANRVYVAVLKASRAYAAENSAFFGDCQELFEGVMRGGITRIMSMGPPHPVLQSPFSKVKFTHSGEEIDPAAGNTTESENSVNPEEKSKVSLIHPDNTENPGVESGSGRKPSHDFNDDLTRSVGVFSFTSLFKEELPSCPSVVLSDSLLWLGSRELLKLVESQEQGVQKLGFERTSSGTLTALTEANSEVINFDCDSPVPKDPKEIDGVSQEKGVDQEKGKWREAYVVITSDGYVHVMGREKSDIPDRSYYLRQCEIYSMTDAEPHRDFYHLLLEVRPIVTATYTNKLIDGVVLRVNTPEQAQRWRTALGDPYAWDPYVDMSIENAAKEAMLRSLPIIMGETAKVNLELKKYQEQYDTHKEEAEAAKKAVHAAHNPESPTEDTQTEAPTLGLDSTLGLDTTESSDPSVNPSGTPVSPVPRGKEAPTATQQFLEDFEIQVVDTGDNPYNDSDDDDDSTARLSPVGSQHGIHQGSNSSLTPEKGEIRKPSGDFRHVLKRGGSSYTKNDGEYVGPRVSLNRGGSVTAQKTNAKERLYGFGSAYKKGEDSWIRIASEGDQDAKKSKEKGVKNLVPALDGSVPLAKRHNNLIKQYEAGLKQEKEKVVNKVKATRGTVLKDFGLEVTEGDVPKPIEPERAQLVRKRSEQFSAIIEKTTHHGPTHSSTGGNRLSPTRFSPTKSQDEVSKENEIKKLEEIKQEAEINSEK